MIDLECIHAEFARLSNHIELFEGGVEKLHAFTWTLYDEHKDADAWIAADESQRHELRHDAESKHKAIIAEQAHLLSSYRERKNAWMREWRRRNPSANKANQKRWREANREFCRKHMKTFRAKVKSDPVKYAKSCEEHKMRMRAKRARLKAAREMINPPVPKFSPEEKRRRKNEWDRAHRKPWSKRTLTESQKQARRDYQRLKYQERKGKNNAQAV